MANADESTAADQQGAAEPISPPEWYGAGVRPTEPRSPADELAGFHLADGYTVRLFAAEPDIAKPMNLAWDAQGRLWVTDSFEYPYGAAEGETPRDCVRILRDTDGDGAADQTTIFATGLNIPIGVLPYGDGCLCFSIPNIYYLRDTDGDDRCDVCEVVLGPFDTTRDTHGMINSLRMGNDGWVYANHGFNNQSEVSGTDGHVVRMQSGNSFRFRPDGSRVEQVSWGQVNPFGRANDEWGYAYAADCHSKPISQLIQDGYYPSFGRPHDGLGFIPPMMDHLHGSTAIAGLEYFGSGLEMQGLSQAMLSGNVMTSRLNRNHIEYHGTTAKAVRLPDFLTSDDPWFRPVDVRMGPDGFIYVADFYNKIIGHYEVPLDHPGRDRFRGRIWQIRTDSSVVPAWQPIQAGNLIEMLQSTQPLQRSLALQYAMENASPQLDSQMRHLLESTRNADGLVSAAWYLVRRGLLSSYESTALMRHDDPRVRVQSLVMQRELLSRARHPYRERAADASTTAETIEQKLATAKATATAALNDMSPHVQRAGAELLGRFAAPDAVADLLELLPKVPAEDAILRQTVRIALRNQLRRAMTPEMEEQLKSELQAALRGDNADDLATIMLATESRLAGVLLLSKVQRETLNRDQGVTYLQHSARCLVDTPEAARVIEVARDFSAGDLKLGRSCLNVVADALQSREQLAAPLNAWAIDLAREALAQVDERIDSGDTLDVRWQTSDGSSWPKQVRKHRDGREQVVTSSFPMGETATSELWSSPFPAPAEIKFFIAGHNGFPDQADHHRNRVELMEVETGSVIQTAYPPRNDALQPVSWDLRALNGKEVRLRLVDGDTGTAFAWMAVGGFQPERLEPGREAGPLFDGLELVRRFGLREFDSRLLALCMNVKLSTSQRAAVGSTLAKARGRGTLSMLFASAAAEGLGRPIAATWMEALGADSEVETSKLLADWARQLDAAAQRQFAIRMVNQQSMVDPLLGLVSDGVLSASVLQSKEAQEKLAAIGTEGQQGRAAELLAGAPPLDQAAEQAMPRVLAALEAGEGNLAMGVGLFTKHCAVCHQLRGMGEVVGPQLDGVGGRGTSRLLEDIMLPDRNVDRAFRTTTILTFDGQVVTGLVRNEDEHKIEMASNDGKPIQVLKEDVEQRKLGQRSLMPSNFHETMRTEELASLLLFLRESVTPAP